MRFSYSPDGLENYVKTSNSFSYVFGIYGFYEIRDFGSLGEVYVLIVTYRD